MAKILCQQNKVTASTHLVLQVLETLGPNYTPFKFPFQDLSDSMLRVLEFGWQVRILRQKLYSEFPGHSVVCEWLDILTVYVSPHLQGA